MEINQNPALVVGQYLAMESSPNLKNLTESERRKVVSIMKNYEQIASNKQKSPISAEEAKVILDKMKSIHDLRQHSKVGSVLKKVTSAFRTTIGDINEIHKAFREAIGLVRTHDNDSAFVVNVPTLEFSEEELRGMGEDDLWNSIEKDNIKKLVIHSFAGETITYEPAVLRELLDIKPSFDDLTTRCTLTFSGGTEQHVETRAKLRLCGDIFKYHFEEFPDSKEVPFTDSVTLKNFRAVLAAVERGKYTVDESPTAKYLLFPPLSARTLPESVIGEELLRKHLGYEGEVPRPSREFFEALEAPCPFDPSRKTKDTHVVTWVPPKLSLNKLVALINSDRSGANKIGYDEPHTPLPYGIEDRETEGGYWLMMLKKPLDLEATKSVHNQYAQLQNAETYIRDNYKNYEIPSTVDAMQCILLNYVCSGEKKERILRKTKSICCIYCKENGQDRFEIGYVHIYDRNRSSPGIYLSYMHGEHEGTAYKVGTVPVRKFY